MNYKNVAKEIIDLIGGTNNILDVSNCITRLRIQLKDENVVFINELKKMDAVLGVVNDETLQIVIGPGKVTKVKNEIDKQLGTSENNWQENKKEIKNNRKDGKLKNALRTIGEIFIPLIPAIIAAGIFNGLSGLLTNLINTGIIESSNLWVTLKLLFSLIGGSFLGYFAIFTGINAAKKFGATIALGGMLGAITVMGQINDLSEMFGLYNVDSPLHSILRAGKGGVIGVIFGVFILAQIEKRIREMVPDVLDLILTPLLTILITTVAMLFVVMPISGLFSDYLVKGLELLVSSNIPFISVLSGYILSALFLPMVLLGLHHGLIPIYAVQLEALGGVSLFPVLAMAGAGQVGAAIAIYFKAKKVDHHKLKQVIAGALPAGFLGIGEPLIYGVTLPMGKPFITAGLGAGFGGAYVMLQHVLANAWGPSGITAIPLMKPDSMIHYFIGLVISYIGGYIVTQLFIKDSDVLNVAK